MSRLLTYRQAVTWALVVVATGGLETMPEKQRRLGSKTKQTKKKAVYIA